MLRLLSETIITAQPTKDFPSRTGSYTLNFITECETSSSWANFTDTAKLKFPKNIYFINQDGKKVSWEGKTVVANTINQDATAKASQPPLILRGDKIQISLGYVYPDINNNLKTQMNVEFIGYISKIIPSMPIEIECEDNMYLLKKAQVPNKQYTGSIQSMLEDMFAYAAANYPDFAAAKLTISNYSEVSVAESFITQNETIAQVLMRVQKDYYLESYFRGNELRCNALVYYPDESNSPVFAFQSNIISDDLEYRRLDDYRLAVKAKSVSKVKQLSTRKDGKPRKVTKQLSVFVTKDLTGKLVQVPEAGWEGEKRTQYFFTTDKNELMTLAGQALDRLYFEGLKGSITAFGLPFVKHGDNVVLRDDVLPERNGVYKAKKVAVVFGENGFRRKVELDERVDILGSQIA